MHGKMKVNPVLQIKKGPAGNPYIGFIQGIQAKYGVFRWTGNFPALIFRHMWMLLNEAAREAPTDPNGVIKNYINYLKVYKSVFNLTTKTVEQLHTEGKKQLPAFSDVQWNKNIYSRLEQQNSLEVNKVENKNYSASEPFGKADGMQNERFNPRGSIILHSLTGVNVLCHIPVRTDKTLKDRAIPALEFSTHIPDRQAPAESTKVGTDKLRYLEQQRERLFENRAEKKSETAGERIEHFIRPQSTQEQLEASRIQSRNQEIQRFYREETRTTGANLQYHRNPDRERGASERTWIKPNTTESTYSYSQRPQEQTDGKTGYAGLQILLKRNIPVEALLRSSPQINPKIITKTSPLELAVKGGKEGILRNKKGSIRREDMFSSETMKQEVHPDKSSGLTKSAAARVKGINLRTLDVPLQSEDASGFENEFYINNIIHRSSPEFMPALYRGEAAKTQDRNAVRVLSHAPVKNMKEAMGLHKNNGLTFLKTARKETGASDNPPQLQEVQPVRKEPYSRTFTAPKENKEFKDIGTDEINLLADRVFKVLEKRMEIRKDRRGLR